MGVGGSASRPGRLYPRERPVTHCTGGWVGPRAGLDRCGKFRPPTEFDPRSVLPVASRYTDWTTAAHQRVHLKSPNGSLNNKETTRNETKKRKTKKENQKGRTMTIIPLHKTHDCTRLVSHCSWTNCMEDHLLKFSELVSNNRAQPQRTWGHCEMGLRQVIKLAS